MHLVLLTVHNGLGKLGGSRADRLVLLGGEDIDSHKVALGGTVLANLGLGDIDDLAGPALDHNCATQAP